MQDNDVKKKVVKTKTNETRSRFPLFSLFLFFLLLTVDKVRRLRHANDESYMKQNNSLVRRQ